MVDKREQPGGTKVPQEARWPAAPLPRPPQVVRPGVMPAPVLPAARAAAVVVPPSLTPEQMEFMAAVQEIASPPAMEGCSGSMVGEAPAGECPGCPAPGAPSAPMAPMGPVDVGPGFTLAQGALGPEGCAFSTPAGPLAGSPIGDGGISPFDGGVPPVEDGLVPPVSGEPIGPGFTLPQGGVSTIGCAISSPAGALSGSTLAEIGVLDSPVFGRVGLTVAQQEKIKCTDEDKSLIAQIIYSETSGLRAQFKEGTKEYTPESLTTLHDARTAIGHTVMNRKQAGKFKSEAFGAPKKPTDDELKLDYVKRAWDDSVSAAKDACEAHEKCSDPTGGATHFFMRPSTEEAPSADLKAKWGLAEGKKPAKSYGPLRDQSGKDMPDKSIDFYAGVKY